MAAASWRHRSGGHVSMAAKKKKAGINENSEEISASSGVKKISVSSEAAAKIKWQAKSLWRNARSKRKRGGGA